MSALLFPGQGSQVVGMGSEFYSNYEIVKNIFKEADEKLNYSISKLILDGPEDELQLTKNTQPAILIVSYAIYKVIQDEFGFDFNSFIYFAGHSLGEYSALVAADSLKLEDAVTLVHERGKLMQEAVPEGEGAMLAVMGLNIDELNSLLKKYDEKKGICEIANDNSLGQIILSGNKETLFSFSNNLKAEK